MPSPIKSPALKSVSLALLISASVFVLDSCIMGDNEFDWYACILAEPNASPMPSSQPSFTPSPYPPSSFAPGPVPLYPKTSRLWGREGSGTPKKIPICWADSAYAKAEYAESRETVRRAVEETWENALDIPGLSEPDRIGFVGWNRCQAGEKSVVIQVADDRPQAYGLGTDNLYGSGIRLNFEFGNWSATACRKDGKPSQFCVYKVAVHEFGHLLGLAHEHNRPDTDRETCDDAPQGNDGDVLVGAWDEQSVMNYCNPTHGNAGKLSRGDVYGIQKVYYPAWFSASCDVPVVIAQAEKKPAGAPGARPAAPERSVARQKKK